MALAPLRGKRCGPVFKSNARNPDGELAHERHVANSQGRVHVGSDAGGKFGGAAGIQRNGKHPTQHAAMKGGDPFRAVFAPDNYPVAGTNAALDKQCGKAASERGDLSVGGYAAPVALVTDHGDLAIVAAKVVEECSQIVSHGRSGRFHEI